MFELIRCFDWAYIISFLNLFLVQLTVINCPRSEGPSFENSISYSRYWFYIIRVNPTIDDFLVQKVQRVFGKASLLLSADRRELAGHPHLN